MNNQIDILNLEWPGSDRDLHIVTPILVYLSKKKQIKVVTKSIFNGYYYLWKYRPKMLLISNFAGDKLNHEIVKLAYRMNIKVVSLISEGNVKEKASEEFLWGWNKDKVLYVDKMLLWSKRSEALFLAKYPELKSKLVTVGATGFDRYKILDFKTKEQFLYEQKLPYQKIIGLAAWGFDHFFGDYFQEHQESYYAIFGEKQIQMHRDDLYKLRRIYQELIEKNRDILFILRYHPGTVDSEKNEFYGLHQYENVFISKRDESTQYTISDLINISDIWVGYETTTALEAWLLGKETFLINPTKTNFVRENIYKGSPIAKSMQEAQQMIDAYYRNGTIDRFKQLQTVRQDIIRAVIEYDDGKNYIRAADEVLKVLAMPDRKLYFRGTIVPKMMKQAMQMLLAKTMKSSRYCEKHYSTDFADAYYYQYMKAIHV